MNAVHSGSLSVFTPGRFFQRWKPFFGALFARGESGLARLELFGTQAQLSALLPVRIVGLDNLVAVRIVNTDRGVRVIQLVHRDATVTQLSCDTPEMMETWHRALCKTAFPDHFVSLGNLRPTCSNDDDDDQSPTLSPQWDANQFPVLLLQGQGGNKSSSRLTQGNYDLYFKDSLLLKDGNKGIEAWNYSQITWFAIGNSSIGMEIDGAQLFEFKCSRPSAVLDALLALVELRQSDTTPDNLLFEYTQCFVPIDHPIRMRQEEEKLKKRPSLLFRRSSQKKKNAERDEFETNADSEWIHYNKAPMAIINENGGEKRETIKPIPPPRRPQPAADLTNALNFKHHLERSIAVKQNTNTKSFEDPIIVRLRNGNNRNIDYVDRRDSIISEPVSGPILRPTHLLDAPSRQHSFIP